MSMMMLTSMAVAMTTLAIILATVLILALILMLLMTWATTLVPMMTRMAMILNMKDMARKLTLMDVKTTTCLWNRTGPPPPLLAVVTNDLDRLQMRISPYANLSRFVSTPA
jgi:hypothetical protein